MSLKRHLLASLLVLPWVAAPPLAAQDYERPPAGIGDDDRQGYGISRAPVDAPDPAGLAVRVGRLEGRVRDMTGQIEELQNANRKLIEQVQKFQADVDSRTAPGAPRTKRSDVAPPPAVVAGESGDAMDADGVTPKPTTRKSREDAFDPDKAPSNVPGQPKPLGSVASTQSDDGNAPMDLSGGKLRRSDSNADTLPMHQPPVAPKPTTAPLTPNGTVTAEATPETPRAAFDVALGYYKDKQYDNAEKGFTAFIQKNPKNRLVADATYYLGESFAQRGRSREAAEQYLKISTDFANSTRAPDAMLHLGMSLKALGAKEQACATFTEVSRKYPNAPAYVRTGAEREAKRAQC